MTNIQATARTEQLNLAVEEYVRARFPKLVERHALFEVGAGWFEIIEDFLKVIEIANSHVTVSQFFEDSGALRMHVNDRLDSEHVNEYVSDAIARSQKTCEICGEPGSKRYEHTIAGVGFVPIKTRCDECNDEEPIQ